MTTGPPPPCLSSSRTDKNNSSNTGRILRCSTKVLDRLRATSKPQDIMETRGPKEEKTTTIIPLEKIAQAPTRDQGLLCDKHQALEQNQSSTSQQTGPWSRTMPNCGGQQNGSAGTNDVMAPYNIETKPRAPSAEKPKAKTGMTIKTFRATY